MKVFYNNHSDAAIATREQALTLVEMMIAMGIFSLVVAALVYTHIFGLRQSELVQSKCGASSSSRRGFDLLTRDIRSSKLWEIGSTSGSGTNVTFTPISLGSQQRGNAVRLHLATTTSTNIVYYFDTTDPNNCYLYRLHTGDTASSVIASNLYNSGSFPNNSLSFTSENYNGTSVQTDRTYKSIIHTVLEFRQFQYPLTAVGPGSNYLYDYYKMEFKLTPHVPQ